MDVHVYVYGDFNHTTAIASNWGAGRQAYYCRLAIQ